MSQNSMNCCASQNQARPMNRMNMTANPQYMNVGAMSKEQLIKCINEVSFVISDMLLYLDTHPEDQKALAVCKEHIIKRKQYLKDYARAYGPLTIDTADDCASDSWAWVNTPWPWEGRKC